MTDTLSRVLKVLHELQPDFEWVDRKEFWSADLNSLDLVELQMGIEEEFDIEIEDDKFMACETPLAVSELLDQEYLGG